MVAVFYALFIVNNSAMNNIMKYVHFTCFAQTEIVYTILYLYKLQESKKYP